MSLFDNLKRRKEAAEAARRPAFGIVGTPNGRPAAKPAATAQPAARTIVPTEYGLAPRDRIRADRAYEDPELDALAASAGAGDWKALSAAFDAVGSAWERRFELVQWLGNDAVDDGAWLDQWLAERPEDPTALVLYQRTVNELAKRLRGGGWSKDLTDDQRKGFLRVIKQVPEIYERARAASAPQDPTPYAAMLGAAMTLGWSHDEFRALFAEVTKRAPYHVEAHLAAMINWLPRWGGSTELVTAFVDEAISTAPVGSLLTVTRLGMLYMETELLRGQARQQAYQAPSISAAIDEALADLAAADPTHPRYAILRHWLAFFCTKTGRYAEALEHFRLLGGYCGSWPWAIHDDPAKQFAAIRAQAVLGWEDAGRPALPTLPTVAPARPGAAG